MESVFKTKIHNRVLIFLVHTNRYAFKSQSRLARDAGVSKSAVSRLVTGQSLPLFVTVTRITKAIEKAIGKKIDPRELLSKTNCYPTPTVCQIVGCKGCCYTKSSFQSLPLCR